eukprot:TRINITY_DN9277_c0_g2_i1.p1 TRINITY_DN9277_c0_g2~~TRINITY_DN9277_c0_g2_i1.p1  ORF type:complete len:718 (+),score=229.90 TRINITY_DN9277_c0_g2_i1:105-2156(+)
MEGREYVHAIRLAQAVTSDLGMLHKLDEQVAEIVPGMSIFLCVLQACDEPLCAQVRTVAALHRQKGEAEPPKVLFELYFVLHNGLKDFVFDIDPEMQAEIGLCEYDRLIEPSVSEWLKLAKSSGERWIANSIQQDPFEITEVYYSSSAMDVFRAFLEIIRFWEQLDWPRKDTAEERLFLDLSDSVCHCIGFYAQKLLEFVLEHETADHPQDKPYFYTPRLCVAMNNLIQARRYMVDVKETMRLDEVLESHRRKALIANEGHRGEIKPHKAERFYNDASKRLDDGLTRLAEYAATRIDQLVKPEIIGVLQTLDESEVANIVDRVETHLDRIMCFIDAESPGLNRRLSERRQRMSVSMQKRSANHNKRRKGRGRRVVQLQPAVKAPDAYLYDNLDKLMLLLDQNDERLVDVVIEQLLRTITNSLRVVVLDDELRSAGLNTKFMSRFALAARNAFKQFFSGDGNGLDEGIIDEVYETCLDPVLNYTSSSTQELIMEFYKQASAEQSQPLKQALADPHSFQSVSSTLGTVQLTVSYDRASDLGRVVVKRLRKVEAHQLYINARLQPAFSSAPQKWRLPTVKTCADLQDHTIDIEEFDPEASVLQLRVQARRKVRMDLVIGEVLIPLHLIKQAKNREVSVTLPLHGLEYPDQIGWIQRVIQAKAIADPADQAAALFVKKYQHRPAAEC